MGIKTEIGKILPESLKSILRSNAIVRRNFWRLEIKNLSAIPRLPCDTVSLKPADNLIIANIFDSDNIHSSWMETEKEIDSFNIPDLTGGVNPGDRRALYYLIRHIKPNSILEVGTHIGASTIHIASALHKNLMDGSTNSIHLKTLDIRDVNSTTYKPWLEFGTKSSPIEMITSLNFQDFVDFQVGTSLEFLKSSTEKFDFIFLDGDHTGTTVYQEIPLALKRLNKNGIILLHDYFPDGKPLWSDKSVAPGPYLATERHLKEGANIEILPLGALPWKTKLNSNFTSLALLVGR